MAYATKYRFTFDSIHGTAYRILVQKDGYSGSIIERALGRPPVIKRKKSGRVLGTSLEFFAECREDVEFAAFFTPDPTMWRVQVYRGNSLVWTGFLSPELYSEPDVAPPYDVHVIATDGLGELKLHNFEAIGDTTLQSLFGTLLLHTGVSVNTNFVSALSATDANGGSVTAQALWTSTFINVDYLAGKTCYEVLQYMLDTLCACITMHDAEWVIWRENDITSADVAVASVTAMGAGGLWPVGNMTRKVEPAKKVISVAAPYHPWTTLENPGMTEDADWTKTRYAYIASEGAYRVTPAEYGQTIDIDWLAQSITSYANKEYNLEITFDPHFTLLDGSVGALHVQVSFTPASLAALYLSRKDDGTLEWKEWGGSVNVPILQPGVSGTPSTMTQYIPPITNAGYTGIIGTLQIRLSFYDNVARAGYGGAIYSCYLYPVGLPYGFKDILNINNGARGEGGDVEVAHGRITSDIYTAYNGYLRGVFKVSGGFYLVTFADRTFAGANQEFLSLTAKNYARLVADARFRLTGILDIPSTLSVLPLLLNLRSVYYLVETFSWDLLNDELEVSALSLPAASLSIASETIVNTTKEAAASGGTGGSSSGAAPSGGSTVEWGTASNNYRPLSVNGDESTVALSGHKHVIADVTDLAALIPNAASAQNQLADKNFVNSSIATSTAEFRGTSPGGLTEQEFLEWADALTHNLNDYCYWLTSDAAGNTLYKRYKYDGTQWLFEYTLNNSSFTSDQWAAINSGITASLTNKLAHPDTVLNEQSAGSTALVTAGAIWAKIVDLLSAIAAKAAAAWGAITNNKAPLTVNDTTRTVLLDGWHPGSAGGKGLPVFTAPRTETETYQYAHGTGSLSPVSASVNAGQPRVINHLAMLPGDETNPFVIEGLVNDLAYLLNRGGSCKIYVDNTERTDAAYGYDKAAMFDLSSQRCWFTGTYNGNSRELPSTSSVVKMVIDLTGIEDIRLLQSVVSGVNRYTTKLAYGSTLYLNFNGWGYGPRYCNVTVRYGYYTISNGVITAVEDTSCRERFQFTGQNVGGAIQLIDYLVMTISGGDPGYGILSIELELSGYNNTRPMFTEIGLYNSFSEGAPEVLMPRAKDVPVLRDITPFKSDTYDLGAAATRWRYLHVKRVYLSATSYLEADSNGKVHLYGAPGLVVENGDIASAGAPQS